MPMGRVFPQSPKKPRSNSGPAPGSGLNSPPAHGYAGWKKNTAKTKDQFEKSPDKAKWQNRLRDMTFQKIEKAAQPPR